MSRHAGFQPLKKVRPDSKGRIALGREARGVSSFYVHRDAQGRFLLEPYVEIPASERWLYENREALESVRKGIADVAAGRVRPAASTRSPRSKPTREG